MASKGSGKSGLTKPGIMDPGLGSGQDGFSGVADRVPTFKEGSGSDHRVGRDNADAPIDPRGRGSKR